MTIARIPSGSVLKKFPSALPSGSHKTNSSTEAYCILDCIFHEHDATFYVLDVMCWKVRTRICTLSHRHLTTHAREPVLQGYVLYNCTTEFRLYWLRDKLSEGTAATVSSANPFRFLVRVLVCLSGAVSRSRDARTDAACVSAASARAVL